jgi:DNA-3-methyladenine glycosylase
MDKQDFISDFTKAFKKDFYLNDTIEVAKRLIGNILVKRMENGEYLAARLVEVEAYLDSGDLSSHSSPGRTKRNLAMFEDGGIIYIYLIYGIHYCINIVTEHSGTGTAVLLRAAEPILGLDIMKYHRHSQYEHSLCKGPGNLSKAFDLSIEDNQQSLLTPDLFVQEILTEPQPNIATSRRIGITKSSELELRFFLKDNPYASGPKNAVQAKQ